MNLASIMRAIAAAPNAANDQANQFDQQAQDMRMQGLSAPPPQAVNPAYRTPDALGLLIGALLTSGNKNEMADFVAGFQGAKQNKANQDTQRNQQNYQLGQAQKELQATGFERKAANARTMATGLNRGIERAADDAESRRRFNLQYDRTVQKDLATELVKQANAGLTAAKTATEDATRQPKVESIVAGTENKKAGTADITSRTDERKKLLPGKLNAQMRADALKASQIKMNDARIVKINADIQAQAKQVENSWRNVTSQIETRGRTGGGGKSGGVTPTAQFNAYDRELVAIRKQRDGLKKKLIDYNAALELGDPKLKGFYETAIADTNKLINDLGIAGVQATRKREAVKLAATMPPASLGIPPGSFVGPPTGGGAITGKVPGVTVEPIKGKGRGGRVPVRGGNANAGKFDVRIK